MDNARMQAWVVVQPGPVDTRAAGAGRKGRPRAGGRAGPGARAGLRGVPHRPAPRRGRPARPSAPGVTPGHEVVGAVDRIGPGAQRWREGDRVGRAVAGPHLRRLPLLRHRAREPLRGAAASPAGTSTGATPSTRWSTRPTPTRCPTSSTTWRRRRLLCAGIIGYRALQRANLPDGGRLGIYGFGGSAHLTAQVALARGRDGPRHDPLARGAARWPSSSAPPAPAPRTPRRPSRWTRPSCSRRSARSSRPPWPRSTGAARWRSPGST